MSRNARDSANILQEEIRMQFGSPSTTRFLRNLPTFKVDQATPEHLLRLLADLDRAEADQRNSGMTGKRA